MKHKNQLAGFTLLEVMLAIVIIAALAALALPGYQDYTHRARAAEVLAKYDAVRSGVLADISQGVVSNCADIASGVEAANLQFDSARLSVDFQAISHEHTQGYRPVLMVCAKNDKQGGFGVGVAHAAHHEFTLTNKVEAGAVVTDSIVSFAVPLTMDNKASCYVPTGNMLTACGDPIAVPTMSKLAAPPMPAAAPLVAPPKVAMAIPKVQASVMKFSGTDTYIRPAGRNLDTDGKDLGAFTLDISFIGDGSIPAASGGQGPVMFNYGDGTNGHNAISLWNPRSLTVALQGRDYDTGLNVVDGQTHRVTVGWDSATGRLAVYDNGVLVRSFADVSKGVEIKGGGSMVLAHKDNGGTYSAGEAFAGTIFGAAMATGAVTDQQAATPLNQLAAAKPNLLIDMRVDTGTGTVVDTTGRHTLETGGMTVGVAGVEGNLVSP